MNFRSRDVLIFLLFLIATFGLRWYGQRKAAPPPVAPTVDTANLPARPPSPAVPPAAPRMVLPRAQIVDRSVPSTKTTPSLRTHDHARPTPEPTIVPFTVEDGLAVTMGDVVLGVPQKLEPGFAPMGKLTPWPVSEIAYHVQPDLPNPERVQLALKLFEGTPVHFVPFTTQEDVLVFEPGTGACKSYLGRVGGKQPIFLSPGCGPTEIAHEILHALGFIHEQNRADRDRYIRVLTENIEPGTEINFRKLSPEYMRLNALTPFDYHSVMIYPKTMFGVGGRDALESVRPGVEIEPSVGLSPSDRARLNAAFGRGESPQN